MNMYWQSYTILEWTIFSARSNTYNQPWCFYTQNSVHPDNCKQYVERPNISQIQLQYEADRSVNEINNMTKTSFKNSEDHFSESSITVLNSQQDLQKTVTRHDAKYNT